MIRCIGVADDPDLTQMRDQTAADEREVPAFPREPVFVHADGGRVLPTRVALGPRIVQRNGGVVEGRCHRRVVGAVRYEVEVATDHGVGRARADIERFTRHAARPRPRGVTACLRVQRPQRVHLRHPDAWRVVLEMGGDHPQRAAAGLDHEFKREPLHRRRGGVGWPRQQMAEYLVHRQAREDRIAELAAAAGTVIEVGRRAEVPAVIRQRRCQRGELIFAGAAGQAAEADGDFLQTKHIEVGDVARCPGDAGGVDAAVDAAAPLHVPRQEIQHDADPGCGGEAAGTVDRRPYCGSPTTFPAGAPSLARSKSASAEAVSGRLK